MRENLAEYKTETYALRENGGNTVLNGRVDGLEALRQAVNLLLQIEQAEYAIFSSGYGVALADLPGQPMSYVIPEVERRLREALLRDERILAVENFSFAANGRRLSVGFVIKSIYGELSQTAEVTV